MKYLLLAVAICYQGDLWSVSKSEFNTSGYEVMLIERNSDICLKETT